VTGHARLPSPDEAPLPHGMKRAKVVENTADAYASIDRRWRRWCHADGTDPDALDPLAVHRWTAEDAHLATATLRQRLDALKRRSREDGTYRPETWRAAENLIKALDRERGRPDPTRPGQPQPLLRDDLHTLDDAHPATTRLHPIYIARGRAALLALASGTPFQALVTALPPDPDATPTGPLPLAYATQRRPGNLELSDTPPAAGLPSAARDLARALPPGTERLLGVTGPDNDPDAPARPLGWKHSTKQKVEQQLARTARRANIPWTGPETITTLQPDALLLLHQAVDQTFLSRPRDHAIRTTLHQTALRGTTLAVLDDKDARREPDNHPDAGWHLTVPRSKTLPEHDGRTYHLQHTREPATCPVCALDTLHDLRRRLRLPPGPLFPTTDGSGRPTNRRMPTETISEGLTAAARDRELDKTLTSRSGRIGATSQAVADGADLPELQELTGNKPANVGTYVRGAKPYILRL